MIHEMYLGKGLQRSTDRWGYYSPIELGSLARVIQPVQSTFVWSTPTDIPEPDPIPSGLFEYLLVPKPMCEPREDFIVPFEAPNFDKTDFECSAVLPSLPEEEDEEEKVKRDHPQRERRSTKRRLESDKAESEAKRTRLEKQVVKPKVVDKYILAKRTVYRQKITAVRRRLNGRFVKGTVKECRRAIKLALDVANYIVAESI